MCNDCCCHIQAKESDYWKTDIAVEDEIERIIMHIDPDAGVSSDEEDNVAEDAAEMYTKNSATGELLAPPGSTARPQKQGKKGETTDTAEEICHNCHNFCTL